MKMPIKEAVFFLEEILPSYLIKEETIEWNYVREAVNVAIEELKKLDQFEGEEKEGGEK